MVYVLLEPLVTVATPVGLIEPFVPAVAVIVEVVVVTAPFGISAAK